MIMDEKDLTIQRLKMNIAILEKENAELKAQIHEEAIQEALKEIRE